MRKLSNIHKAIICVIFLLILITVAGVLSFRIDKAFLATNQYGQKIKMFGNGVYARDSYFMAPIFIGSDAVALIIIVPALLILLVKDIKRSTIQTQILLVSLMSAVLYYAASIAFGVTYNYLHLAYIGLFGFSSFTLIALMRNLDYSQLKLLQWTKLQSKGLKTFFILSAIALFIAWLPDVITTIITGDPPELIEVYTTPITYVLDMGIMSPLMIIALVLIHKKDELGKVIVFCLLMICMMVGVMLPMQTFFQSLAGIHIPLPALITKVATFVILAFFGGYFLLRYIKYLDYTIA